MTWEWYIESAANVADIGTKMLTGIVFNRHHLSVLDGRTLIANKVYTEVDSVLNDEYV